MLRILLRVTDCVALLACCGKGDQKVGASPCQGKEAMMLRTGFLGCLALLISCGKNERKVDVAPVSGDGSCRTFDVDSSRAKAESGELLAIRGMRDYYLDCVLHNNGPETLHWGQLAAEKGSSQDRETYESLKMTFIPKK